MVSVVFFALFFWAGPVVVPETMRRWKVCQAKAAAYQRLAQTETVRAAKFAARYGQAEAAPGRRRAELYAEKSQRHRRALFIPWEFWSLGDF